MRVLDYIAAAAILFVRSTRFLGWVLSATYPRTHLLRHEPAILQVGPCSVPAVRLPCCTRGPGMIICGGGYGESLVAVAAAFDEARAHDAGGSDAAYAAYVSDNVIIIYGWRRIAADGGGLRRGDE